MTFALAIFAGVILAFVVVVEIQQRYGEPRRSSQSRLIEPSIGSRDIPSDKFDSTNAIVEAMKRRAHEISEQKKMQPSLELYSLEMSRFGRRLEKLETAFNFSKFFAAALGLALGIASLMLSLSTQ